MNAKQLLHNTLNTHSHAYFTSQQQSNRLGDQFRLCVQLLDGGDGGTEGLGDGRWGVPLMSESPDNQTECAGLTSLSSNKLKLK